MSLTTTNSTTTSAHTTKQYSLKLEMDSSAADKEERKREYNRLAQREFRRRRKEHLKSLEQAQKEQCTEKAEEMDRLRYQNEELRRENEALRAQIYASSSSSHHLMTTPVLDNRQYSLSPSISGTSMSGTSSPPSNLIGSELLPLGSLSLSSSMTSHSLPVYNEHDLSTQPYSMVHSSGIHPTTHSSPDSSELRSSRSALGIPHAMKIEISPPSQRYVSGQPAMTAVAAYDPDKLRTELHRLFRPLSSDPNISNDPRRHLETLQSIAHMLPSQLKPNKAQLERHHYYGIDMIPSPSLRDRLMPLSHDVARGFVEEVGILRATSEADQPLLFWGDDPLNEMAWEFSKQILERWGWLLGGVWVQRANFWRRQRGASPLTEW